MDFTAGLRRVKSSKGGRRWTAWYLRRRKLAPLVTWVSTLSIPEMELANQWAFWHKSDETRSACAAVVSSLDREEGKALECAERRVGVISRWIALNKIDGVDASEDIDRWPSHLASAVRDAIVAQFVFCSCCERPVLEVQCRELVTLINACRGDARFFDFARVMVSEGPDNFATVAALEQLNLMTLSKPGGQL